MNRYIHPPYPPVAHIYTDPRIQVPRGFMFLKRKFLNRGPLGKALNKHMFYVALEKHDSAGDSDPGVCVYMGDGRIRWMYVCRYLQAPSSQPPLPSSERPALPALSSQLSAPNSQAPAHSSRLSVPGSQLPARSSQLPAPKFQLPAHNAQLPAHSS